MSDPIVKKVLVNCAPARAFDLFVARMAQWWPLATHSVSAGTGRPARGLTVEPRVGGAVRETLADGSHSLWGEVLAHEPGRRFAMTWHPGRPSAQATRVEVLFEPAAEGRTVVTLTHSGWEILGSAADARREGYAGGWDLVLGQCYAGAARAA